MRLLNVRLYVKKLLLCLLQVEFYSGRIIDALFSYALKSGGKADDSLTNGLVTTVNTYQQNNYEKSVKIA